MFSIMGQILLRINCYIKVTFKRETPLLEKHLIVNVISPANFWITTTWILFWESLTDIFYQSSHRVLYSSDSVHDVSAETSLAEWLIRAVNIFFFSLGKLSLTNPSGVSHILTNRLLLNSHNSVLVLIALMLVTSQCWCNLLIWFLILTNSLAINVLYKRKGTSLTRQATCNSNRKEDSLEKYTVNWGIFDPHNDVFRQSDYI